MAEKKEPKKVVDVAHPGDSEPSSTSKPVIVTNRPIMQDPMVVTDEDAGKEEVSKDKTEEKTESEEHKIEVKKAGGIKLKTLEEAEAAKVEAPEANEPKEDAESEKISTEEPKEEPKEEVVEVQSSIIDEEDSDKIKDPNDLDKEAAETAKREEELQKLIDSKKYYLPIDTIEKRRTHRTVVIGLALSLLLGLAWLNIALDAGLVSLGSVQAVTDFF